MNYQDPNFLEKSRSAFLSKRGITLADLKNRIERREENPTAQRDMLSALNRVKILFGQPLDRTPATPRHVRELFKVKAATALGVSEKTLANIRANVSRAVRSYGDSMPQLTRKIPPSDAWRTLLDKVSNDHWRQGLYRLACFCTVIKIKPSQVNSDTLIGLHEALEEEEVVKAPKGIIKNTISSWNRCRRNIDIWPDIILSSPFKQPPWTLPLDVFPELFRADVARWRNSVTNIDPLALEGPARPLSESTIEQRIREFRMFASALVHRGVLAQKEITGLDILMKPYHFKEAIRYFLERQNNETSPRLHILANAIRLVAKHYVKIDDGTLDTLTQLCKKLNPDHKWGMTTKNRERLRQFENEKNVLALLRLPEKLAKKARALLLVKPLKAARLMERAVIFGLQTHIALRPRTLRNLHLKRNFIWNSGVNSKQCLIVLFPENLKTKNQLEFELSKDIVALLIEHLERFRPHLTDIDNPWLFPGEKGGPRSKNAMYETICSTARKQAGLEINPHLFRHILAKIVIERAPELESSIRQVLGHTTMETTYAHYLGTETKAAGRHLDSLLERILHEKEKF